MSRFNTGISQQADLAWSQIHVNDELQAEAN